MVSGKPIELDPKLAPARPPRPSDGVERLMRTCPVCGSTLEERKCKLFCPDPHCSYFLSCADYY